MSATYFFGLMAFTVVPILVFHMWALIDVAKSSTTDWERAEQSQIVWLIVVLAVFAIGPILYVMFAKPKLVAATDGAAV